MKKLFQTQNVCYLIFVMFLSILGMSNTYAQTGIDSSMVIFDSLGNPKMMKYQVIVKFADGSFLPNALFDQALVSGHISDFILPSILDSITTKSGVTFASTRRLVDWLDPTITYSIGRGGDTINMPRFRNILLVNYDGLASPDSVANQIMLLNNMIYYAEPNGISIIQWVPNDPDHGDQLNLHTGVSINNFSCQVLDGQINARSAWDLEKGKDFVKVGIVDNGVDWRHPDFGNGTLNDNAIKGGYDYVRGIGIDPITPLPFFGSAYGYVYKHGTQMAGIVGARSNDGIGVAGIAGGDMSIQQHGASIYTLRIMQDFDFSTVEDILYAMASDFVPAIIEGASSIPSPDHGFSLDVMNNSWVTSLMLKSLSEAVEFAWENQVTMVAARGNWDSNPTYQTWPSIDYPLYPACYREEWVINVGGSNECGRPKTGRLTWGDGNPNDPADHFSATMTGHQIDVIAPMTNILVTTTNRALLDASYTPSFGSVGSNGTSSSAAQVSGVAALLMSYFNQPSTNGYAKFLAPEDVEYILEHSANQRITYDFDEPGHSYSGGWGLLDASRALRWIEKPTFDILHFEGVGADISTYDGVYTVHAEGPYGLGWYQIERYKLEKTITHNIAANYQILNHWARPSGSLVFDDQNLNYQHPYVWFNGVPNQFSTQMFGYSYKFLAYQLLGNWVSMPNVWAPDLPSNCRFAYSLRVKDIGTSVGTERDNSSLEVFPNPTSDNCLVRFRSENLNPYTLSVFDSNGKAVFRDSIGFYDSATSQVELDTRFFPAGIYLIELRDGDDVHTKKLAVLR